ncbi:hypothetical protein [Bacillus carboniphilus]|uniref:hypothetical protein n=1 Tax=Bacillus carboniphilus TaxID=86663 RepID=UPI0031CF7FDF
MNNSNSLYRTIIRQSFLETILSIGVIALFYTVSLYFVYETEEIIETKLHEWNADRFSSASKYWGLTNLEWKDSAQETIDLQTLIEDGYLGLEYEFDEIPTFFFSNRITDLYSLQSKVFIRYQGGTVSTKVRLCEPEMDCETSEEAILETNWK